MPVETRHCEKELINHTGEFNDSALEHVKDCLQGYKFLLAGITSCISRADLESFIHHCGADVHRRVLSDTTHLIRGDKVGDHIHFHDENTKVEDENIYKEAVERGGVTIISIQQFFELVAEKCPGMSINRVLHPEKDMVFTYHPDSKPRHHKYSLEIAKSDRSKCHGHCQMLIPKGVVRLRACFQPPDEWIYFRCLGCITPTILHHIENEWSRAGGLKGFVSAQPEGVLSIFDPSLPTNAHPSLTSSQCRGLVTSTGMHEDSPQAALLNLLRLNAERERERRMLEKEERHKLRQQAKAGHNSGEAAVLETAVENDSGGADSGAKRPIADVTPEEESKETDVDVPNSAPLGVQREIRDFLDNVLHRDIAESGGLVPTSDLVMGLGNEEGSVTVTETVSTEARTETPNEVRVEGHVRKKRVSVATEKSLPPQSLPTK